MVASPAQAAPIDLLTISDAANWEGGDLVFTVTYTGTAAAEFAFSIEDVDTASADYTGPTSAYFGTTVGHTTSISFNASSAAVPSTATVTVHAASGDSTSEPDQSFTLDAVAQGGTPNTNTTVKGTGTIWEPDANNNVVLSGSTTVSEAATNGVQKSVTITATQTNPQQHDVTVPVQTANAVLDLNSDNSPDTPDFTTAWATPGGGTNRDFTALPATATITIPANQTVGTTTVQIWDDAADEQDTQYFNVQKDAGRSVLGGGMLGGQSPVQIGITDDDATPTISIGDAATTKEGAPLTFPVTLSNPSEKGTAGVTAKLAAAGVARGNATAATRGNTSADPADFVWGGSGVTLAASQQTVTVPRYAKSTNVMIPTTTFPTSTFEGPENVSATLSTPTDATLGTPTTGNGLITDAEAGQTVYYSTTNSIATPFSNANRSFSEGNAGRVQQNIYVKFNSGTLPTTLSYTFVDGTAKNGDDYTGTGGTITVPAAGADPVAIPVTINGDRVDEADETFKLHVTDPNGVANAANIGDITFTITDDDAAPSWGTQDVTVKEGDSGQTMAHIPVNLTSAVGSDATFTATITPGGAVDTGTLAGDNDYDAPTTLATTIKAGESKGYLDVPINGDTVFEKDEAFTVTFTPPATIIDNLPPDIVPTSRVTITNDDAAPKVTFGSFSGPEGGTVAITGTVVGAAQAPYTIGFSATGSGTAPATAGTDFTVPAALATTSFTIPRGFTGALTDVPASAPNPAFTATSVQFPLLNDNVDEATETFTVTATETTSTLQGFVTSNATVKIADDPLDLPPAVSIGDVSVGEWEKSVDIPVTLTFTADNDATSTQQTVTIPYWTVDGAAKAGTNYTATKGTLEIKPGTLTGTINVPVRDDKVKSTAKDFFVKLGTPGPSGATVTTGTAQVLVKDSGNGGSTPPPPSNTGDLTIKAPSSVTGAVTVPITGMADAGATVDLWGAAWSPAAPALVKIASTTADGNGKYSFSRWIGSGYRFKVASGDATSDEIKISVTQAPVLVVSSPAKGKVTVAVQGNPRGPKQTVIVQRWAAGKWVNTWRGTTGSDNLWKSTVSEPSKSKWTLRAFVAGDPGMGLNPGYSATKTVTVK